METQWLPGRVDKGTGRVAAVQVPIFMDDGFVVVVYEDGTVGRFASGAVKLLGDEPSKYWKSALSEAQKKVGRVG